MSYPRITTKASRATMPTYYPFPTVARIALSLYASDRAVERLPRITEFLPCELVYLVRTVETPRKGDWL